MTVKFMSAESPAAVVFSGDRFLFVSPAPSGRRKEEALALARGGEWEEALAEAREAGWRPRETDLVLSARDGLFVVLDLPTSERDEIPAMVELQAEEFTPFALERTAVGWEVLRERPNEFRVLMALAPLNRLQEIRGRLAGDGIRVKRVDVDVLGWLAVLEAPVPEAGGTLWMILEEDTATLVVWDQGVPCSIQNLGDLRECAADEVMEELNMAWMGVEASWGLERPEELTLWHGGDPPEWAGGLPGGLQVESRSLPEPLRAVEGVLERGRKGSGLDLAPPEWEREHQARLRRLRLLRRSVWAAALWVLALGGLVLWVRSQKAEVREMEDRRVQRAPEVEEVRELGGQVRSLSKFTDRSSSVLEVVWLLAEAAPGVGGIEVEDLRYRKEEGVVFSGSVEGRDPLFLNFVESLGGSELLRVEDYNLTRERDGDQRFQVTTRWRWLPSESETEGGG